MGFSLLLQISLNNNFLVEEIHVSGFQAGLLEAARESCGIYAFGILALIAGLAEPLIGAIVLLVLAVGLASYAFVPTYGWVVLSSLVWSTGLHVWMPLPNSMALALSEEGKAGGQLGRLAASGAGGAGLALVLAFILNKAHVPIRPLYLISGSVALLGAISCLMIPRAIKTPGPTLVFRRRYAVYYLLCFFEGWRKQIALCFAGFLLVKNHGASVSDMVMLWGFIQFLSWLAAPPMGRLIDCVGEKRVLTSYYSALIGVFIIYAFVSEPRILYVVFVIDGVLSVCTTAFTTYVNHIAPKNEHTPLLSMGVAANHVAAVTMPLTGGFLWNYAGYRWAFLIGIPAAIASMAVVMKMRTGKESSPACR
ncbi:MAG TPA: MFS transporter [Candidatus Brocadiia bacterium]|nr:MFS transporter [Candidatus Brocadiia bacterium]